MKNIDPLGFALFCYAALGAVLGVAFSILVPGGTGAMLAVIAWLFIVGGTVTRFLVVVPAQTSLVLVNGLSGGMRELSPGIAIKLPWETAPLENFLELRTLNVPVGGEFIANDGPVVRVGGTVQVRIKAGSGLTVVSHSEEAFFKGIKERCASFLSEYIGSRSARVVRDDSRELEQQLLRYLRSGDSSLASEFGAEATLVAVADVSFDDTYQKARAQSAAAAELTDIAQKLRRGAMTEADALEAAMVFVSGDIRKRIIDVRGEGADAIVTRLLELARAMRR